MSYSRETHDLAREIGEIVRGHSPQGHTILYETEPLMGYGEVLFIDSKGVHISCEAMGMWAAYSSDVQGPSVSTISSNDLKAVLEQYGSAARAEMRGNINNYRRRT